MIAIDSKDTSVGVTAPIARNGRAILMKRFFHREKDNADEAWYYLARDAGTGAVYVERQWGIM